MQKLLKIFYTIFFIMFHVLSVFAMAPGQFKPQDIDAILNSMTEDDFNNILNELSKLSPQELEELEKIGRQVLIESGIDPDTGRPLEQQPPIADKSSALPEAPTVDKVPEAAPALKVHNPANVQLIIDSIIENIHNLRQKAQGNEQIARRLSQWAEPLNDLLFYLKIINKKEHLDRLSTQDFDTLFDLLEKLHTQLALHQPHIILPKAKVPEDNPYRILGIHFTASTQEITKRYLDLKKKYDIKEIRKNLKKVGASQKEIDREIHAAKLTLSLIQDAYDQLNDPKTKNLIDKKWSENKDNALAPSSQSSLTSVIEAISTSVYQHTILDQLQNFLKKYEPEELTKKNAAQAAQEQRKKDLAEFAKVRPTITTTEYDKKYPQQLPRSEQRASYASPGGYPDFMMGMGAPTTRAPQKYDPFGSPQKDVSPSGSKGASSSTASDSKKREDKISEEDKKKDDKKKKGDEKKQKELEEKLKKYEEKEKLEKLKKYEEQDKKQADSEKQKKKLPAKAQPLKEEASAQEKYVEKKHQATEQELTPQLDAIENTLETIAQRNNEINAILEKANFDDSVITELNKLALPTLLDTMLTFGNNLPINQEIREIINKKWTELWQSHRDIINRLVVRIEEEHQKYSTKGLEPQGLVDMHKITEAIKRIYTSIADKLAPHVVTEKKEE